MKNSYIYLFILLANCCFAELKLPEQSMPPKLVYDFANVLQPAEENSIEQKLRTYEDSTSTQFAVVTIASLQGYESQEFATALYRKWGVGDKQKDNGFLLLIAPNERKLFIATGLGVQGKATDGQLQMVINKLMKPQLKVGNYFEAINNGIDGVITIMGNEFVNENPGQNTTDSIPIWVIILLIIIVFIIISRGSGRNGGTMIRRGEVADVILWNVLNNLGGRGGGGWGGGDSSGGGFGGFGGGTSDGGGAGGDW